MMLAPNFLHWLGYEPYGLDAARKHEVMLKALRQLTQWHAQQCPDYQQVMEALQVVTSRLERLEDVPYLPVRLFKEFDLLSVPREDIFKTMTSSGTSGQQVSRIFLDKATASLQTKVLARLMTGVIGNKRIPMLVLDSPSVLKDRLSFSARGAGILGFSMFGLNVTYALDNDMQLDISAVESFIERHFEGPIFLFGFTFMIWQYLVQPLLKNGSRLPLDRGILLHGGGWKKLQDQAVDNDQFKQALLEVSGLTQVVNYYGMVEQTGSLYMECEKGYLHAPVFSDVIVRRFEDFAPAGVGEEGVIEVLSMLPVSYPGHALLTEDLGTILGEDDCPCGRFGKYFHVHGRLAQAEVRGCSDTHEAPR
jgi:phenylacetate-coenzyme A ligase PaaK-like adenylate-forming protein